MHRNQILSYTEQSTTVMMSVDFIRISIDNIYFNTKEYLSLFNEFSRMSVTSSKLRVTGGEGYNMTKKYIIKFNNQIYKVEASKSNSTAYLPTIIKIHKPDTHLLKYLEPYLKLMLHKVNAVEFTLDFIGYQYCQIYKFMDEHLLINWPDKKKFKKKYKTTFYLNNIRKSKSKGGRCYIKTLTGDDGNTVESVRVEVLLKRRILQRKTINSITDFLKMDNIIPLKYIAFQNFNFNYFYNKMSDECHYCKQDIESLISSFKNEIKNGNLDELNDKAKAHYNNDDGYITYLKHHSFHKYFMSKASGLSFINGDIFSVDVEKML